MSNELNVTFPTAGASLYAILRRVSDGQVWDAGSAAFEAWADGSIGDYDIPLTSQGGDLYAADLPAAIPLATRLRVLYYEMAGASPATADLVIQSRDATAQELTLPAAATATPTGGALITVARAQQLLALAAVSSAVLTPLILAASEAVENECDRKFTPQTLTETYDGDGTNSLLLDNYPVASVTSVTITDDDDVATVILGAEFRIDSKTAEIQFKPSSTADYTAFPVGFRNVSVVYVVSAAIPEAVQQAVAETVSALYFHGTRDMGLSMEVMGSYTWSAGAATAAMPGSARALLAPLRDPSKRIA